MVRVSLPRSDPCLRGTSYIVGEDEAQTTFTGREQRHGVWVLAFLVAGLFDRREPGRRRHQEVQTHERDDAEDAARRLLRSLCDGHGAPIGSEGAADSSSEQVADEECNAAKAGNKFDWARYRAAFSNTPVHAAVTAMMAEYALLVGRITRHLGAAAASPMTLSEGTAIAEQAQQFILFYATPILGDLRTTKIHRLLCHVLHAVRYHGNILNANTSVNESRHKEEKRHYLRTNKRPGFTRQLVRHAQGTRAVLRQNEEARVQELRVARSGDEDAGYSADVEQQAAPLRRARTAHLPHAMVGVLSAAPGMFNLARVSGLRASDRVAVPTYVYFMAQLSDGRCRRQVVRASAMFHGKKWYDHVLFSPCGVGTASETRYGQVRLLLRQDGGRDVAVVAEMEHAIGAEECPLSARGCTQLRWTEETLPGAPHRLVKLRTVPVDHIIRVVHIVPDCAEMCRRVGVGSTPPSFGESGDRLWAMRYLFNAFLPEIEQ